MLDTILSIYLTIGLLMSAFIIYSGIYVADSRMRLTRMGLRMNFWYALFTLVFVTVFWLPNLIYGILRKRNG